VFFPVHFSRIFARAFLGSYAGYYPAFSFFFSPALNAGFHFVHSAV
jgi:hypothetical protein